MEVGAVRWAALAVAWFGFGQMWGQATTAASAAKSVSCVPRRQPPSDAEAALSRREYDKAIDLYGKLARTAPDESRAGVIRTMIEQNKVQDAEDLARAWVKEQPKNAVAEGTLSEVYYREAEMAEALAAAREAHRLDPCNGRPYLTDAVIEHLTANHKAEKMHVDLAYSLAPTDVEVRQFWIGTLSHQRQLEEEKLLLADERLLPRDERTAWQKAIADAKPNSKDPCTLVNPTGTGRIPIVPVMDGVHPTGRAGLEISFNGKQRRLDLDTGASGLLLTKAAAAALGLTHEAKLRVGGVGDKGAVESSYARVASIKMGNLEFQNCEVIVLDKGTLLDDGLIGSDVFRNFLVTIDFPKLEVRVDPLPRLPDETAPEDQSLNTASGSSESGGETATPVLHNRYVAPEMKDWQKIYRNGHDLLVAVRINEAKSKLFIVDTGAGMMSISPDAAREFTKVTQSDDRVFGVAGEVNKVYETGKFKIEFADMFEKVDHMTALDMTELSHDSGFEISGFLGNPILYNLVLHIDYRDNLMKFEAPGKR